MKSMFTKISHRLLVLICMFLLGMAAFSWWGFQTMRELNVNGPVYQRIIQGKDLIADILPPPEYILEAYLTCFQISTATDKPQQEKLVARLKVLKGDYDTRHTF